MMSGFPNLSKYYGLQYSHFCKKNKNISKTVKSTKVSTTTKVTHIGRPSEWNAREYDTNNEISHYNWI